jgi:2-dehydro-3-deoxyphosphogluconate aldolase / (4S)-4-hydroxy-2-oxoglutarate aldolase
MWQKIQAIGKLGIVPVVQIDNANDSIKLGNALLEGGLPCAEITFRTEAAEDAIRSIANNLPEILLGAGAVLTTTQAEKAVAAGAQFIVSPGLNPKVVDWCQETKIPIIPGVATPTEIEMALDKGITVLKFFPAEAMGGGEMLKAISAPYGAIKFIPTGGINAQNLAEYLKMPMVFACGGSWFVKSKLVSTGDFKEITRLTHEAVLIVRQVRDIRGQL